MLVATYTPATYRSSACWSRFTRRVLGLAVAWARDPLTIPQWGVTNWGEECLERPCPSNSAHAGHAEWQEATSGQKNKRKKETAAGSCSRTRSQASNYWITCQRSALLFGRMRSPSSRSCCATPDIRDPAVWCC